MRRLLSVIAVLALFLGCSPAPKNGATADSVRGSNQVFTLKGVVKELNPDGKTIQIRHEAIPNYMVAMTMPFIAKDPKELSGLKPGDAITFRMTVTADDTWIDEIRKDENGFSANKAQGPVTSQLPTNALVRVLRDVDPLQIGDKLPEYHFTNELGQAVSTMDFKGQALAITFIFTRCPLPNFCPRMSSNFDDAQKKLLSLPNAPTNWHLLTISFDPEFDSPVILKSYADRYKADPKHWSFLTGDIADITAISDQFGQKFWREEGAINHNLRTVVIDDAGRVQTILQGNSWTADDLVAELKKATKAQ
jgi:protein SCO1/2